MERILNTKPITCDFPGEIHLLTCERDHLMAMWALKTFFYFNKLYMRPVIHEDGSLSESSKATFKEHFIGSKIIDRSLADELITSKLRPYPNCLDYRDTGNNLLLKLFDPYFFSESEYMLIMDSDVLWFKKAEMVLSFVANKYPFFHGGGWGFNSYPVSIEYMKDILGLEPVGNINGGIVGRSNKDEDFDLEFIESALKGMKEAPRFYNYKEKRRVSLDALTLHKSLTMIEETLLSVIIGRCKDTKILWAGKVEDWSPYYCKIYKDEYLLKHCPVTDSIAMIHYVEFDKEQKIKQYKEGISYLIEKGFLNE